MVVVLVLLSRWVVTGLGNTQGTIMKFLPVSTLAVWTALVPLGRRHPALRLTLIPMKLARYILCVSWVTCMVLLVPCVLEAPGSSATFLGTQLSMSPLAARVWCSVTAMTRALVRLIAVPTRPRLQWLEFRTNCDRNLRLFKPSGPLPIGRTGVVALIGPAMVGRGGSGAVLIDVLAIGPTPSTVPFPTYFA